LPTKLNYMRKIFLSFSALLMIAMMTVSCGGGNSPKDVANTWLTSFYHMDYDAAKKVSTEETKAMLTQLSQLSGMVGDSSKKELKKITVNVKDVKENGDKAVATYTTSDNASKEQTLNLVKKDGKWLVQFTKSDQMGGGDAGGSGHSGTDSTAAPAAPPADAPADTSKH
jgi:Domain of unknown function (DUF4878)